MEKDDVVLIKDIIPNCSLSKNITEMLGTKVKVEDINCTEIKAKGVWIPKEFVKEVVFKHYTEEELARRSKIEDYYEYLTEKTAPLSLRIASSLSNYAITFFEILFGLFIVFFAIGVAIDNNNFTKFFVIYCFFCMCSFFLAVVNYVILLAIIKKCKVEENFRKDVRAKTIKSLKVSKEEIERLKLHW